MQFWPRSCLAKPVIACLIKVSQVQTSPHQAQSYSVGLWQDILDHLWCLWPLWHMPTQHLGLLLDLSIDW